MKKEKQLVVKDTNVKKKKTEKKVPKDDDDDVKKKEGKKDIDRGTWKHKILVSYSILTSFSSASPCTL